MKNVKIKDFSTQKTAYEMLSESNYYKEDSQRIIRQVSVKNVGRKYVTIDPDIKYEDISAPYLKVIQEHDFGYDKKLFPDENSAKEYLERLNLISDIKKNMILEKLPTESLRIIHSLIQKRDSEIQ